MDRTQVDGTKLSFDPWMHYDVTQPRWRRAVSRVLDVRNVGWDIGVRAMERVSGHRRGDRMDVRLHFSPRDLLAEKGKVLREDLEALADAVTRARAYPAREEAERALRAVIDAVRDRIPPELLMRLSAVLPEGDAGKPRSEEQDLIAREDCLPSTGRPE